MNRGQLLNAAILFAAATLLSVTTASAETVTLKADLKGSNEVPPNNSPASGTAEATFDTTSKLLTYTIAYKDLPGPALGAHFHGQVDAGKNAGIVLPFKTVQSPIQGSATDERVVEVRLTRKGVDLHPQTACLTDALLRHSGFDVPQMTELNRPVQTLRQGMRQAAGGHPEAMEREADR